MMQGTITHSTLPKLTIPVDPEHGGVRVVVFFVFIGIWLMVFSVANTLIVSEGFNLIALVIGFLIAALITNLLERYLKTVWGSGRNIHIDSDGVRMEKRGTLQAQHLDEDPVSAMFWRFEVNKRTRIPKGWSMLGCALEHEGRYLTVYTFVSPEQLDAFERGMWFKKLIGKKELREGMHLAGEQRRLIEAERHRWMEGAEMTFDNFKSYLARLETQFPEWMPVN
jgi:hypothetical protein